MKSRLYLTLAALVLSTPAFAVEKPNTFDHVKSGFSQAIDGISGWFGTDNAQIAEIPAYEITPENIEPAAGVTPDFNEDVLQTPPQIITPVAKTQEPVNSAPRATAFDDIAAISAFGEPIPSATELAVIATAAGGDADTECEIEADETITSNEMTEETESVSCPAKTEGTPEAKVQEQERSPAQPAFEPHPYTGDLPETRPAAGE